MPSSCETCFRVNLTDDRVFVLPPNSRSASSGEDRIFAAVAIDKDDHEGLLSGAEVVIESGGASGELSGIGLGIDAGGTYTDTVIYDMGERRILAKAKALTTYHNLVIGIRNALAQLPGDLLGQVQVTSLSTTLATNSIVEGRGHKVGIIALTPWGWTEEQVGHSPLDKRARLGGDHGRCDRGTGRSGLPQGRAKTCEKRTLRGDCGGRLCDRAQPRAGEPGARDRVGNV